MNTNSGSVEGGEGLTFTEISGYTGVSFWAGGKELGGLDYRQTASTFDFLAERLRIGVESGVVSLADVVRIFPPTESGVEVAGADGEGGEISWNTWRF